MPDNHQHLQEAQVLAKQFETQLEAERLREAYMALENVLPAEEPDVQSRVAMRADCLALWLNLVDLLDRFLDPNFDPSDVPERLVEPPPIPGGAVLRPGADPALIEDPRARAAYENAIAANHQKAVRYRLQIQLGRLKDRIPAGLEEFVRRYYTSAPREQQELRTAINNLIHNPSRRADLLQRLAPEQR